MTDPLAMTAGRPTMGFLTWSSPVPTGGNVYDDRLAEELVAAGVAVRRHRVPGTWPADGDRHRSEVSSTLRSWPVWLVDSIVACAVPDLVVDAARRGDPLVILLHSLPSCELGLSDADRQRWERREAAASRAARLVITTSRWAADDLQHRYGIARTVVAQPGVDLAPLITGSADGGRLLCLASLTPTKDQLTLVSALSQVTDRPWSLRLVGGDTVRPDYTAALRDAIHQRELGGRITITGPLTGPDLEQVWSDTDLLVVPSRSETYGLVVTEALAHGVPAIVSAGTGAVEALGHVEGEVPGRATPPGDARAMAAVVRAWLGDPQLRRRWRTTARRRRELLPSWQHCASVVWSAVAAE